MSEAQRGKHRLTRPDLAVEILHELVKQKSEEMRQARDQVLAPPRRPRRPLYLVLLFVVFSGLTAWNVGRAGQVPVVFTADEMEASVRYRIYLATRVVEAYRDSAGRFPATLKIVGIDDDGLVYVPSTSTYTILAESGGRRIAYRLGDDLTPFAAAYGALARGGGA
jgi:hypothetical protein